jgi:hypothetical protein
VSMFNKLISTRESLMDEVDQVLDSVRPDRMGDDYKNKMYRILTQMIELVKVMEDKGVDDSELSKTYSYIGQISFRPGSG